MSLLTIATLLALALPRVDLQAVPPEVEVGALAALLGVNPVVAVAVATVESGHLSGRPRERVVSKGNVGVMQVNATEWARVTHRPRPVVLPELQDRHKNIRAGVVVLTEAWAACGQQVACAAAVYNRGWRDHKDEDGVRYAERAMWAARGIRIFRGW